MQATKLVSVFVFELNIFTTDPREVSKSIDEVFHLQQVAQDPTTVNPAKATIPARKPVRQQPRGLKMRFHPIGFGATEPGTIGSSSSDEEDAPSKTYRPVSRSKPTDSDEEMVVGPGLPSRLHPDVVKSSSGITSKKEKKRKHSEGGEKKSKHSSSSRLNDVNRRELKRLKKKQTESPRMLADNLSVLIESQENTEPPQPLRPKTPPQHPVSTTPIPPPKPLIFSQPSNVTTGLHDFKSSSKKSKSTEEPRLTGEERRKMKKLKQKDAKRQKGGLA